MSTSYPYNILVTKNPKVAETLFFDNFGRPSFADNFSRLSPEEQADSLIVSPKGNNNFISLTLDFPKGGSKHNFVSLKMVETNELLEYFTVSKTGFEEVITQKLRINKSLGRTSSSELIDSLRKIRPSFYFAIGVGDDVSEWSGPYLCELIDVNFTITTDNVREVELMFSPMLASQLVFTNKLFNDTKLFQDASVFDSQYNGRSAEVRCAYDGTYDFSGRDEDQLRRAKVVDTASLGTNPIADRYRFAAKGQPSAKDGWNFVVRDLIRNYLSKISQTPVGNILVLLDDDFSYIKKNSPGASTPGLFGLNIFERYRGGLNDLGFKVNPTWKEYSEQSEEVQGTKRNIENLEKIIENESAEIKGTKQRIAINVLQFFDLFLSTRPNLAIRNNWNRVINRAGGYGAGSSYADVKYNPAVLPIVQLAVKEITASDKDLGEGGVTTLKILAQTIESERKDLKKRQENVEMTTEGGIGRKNKELKLTEEQFRTNPDYLTQAQKGELVDLTKLVISIGGKIRQQDIDSNTTTLLDPLAKITNKLGLDGNKPNDFTIFEENNFKILKILKQSGIIEDDQKAILVFGREAIIEKYLYPDSATAKQPSKELVTSYRRDTERLPLDPLFATPILGPAAKLAAGDAGDRFREYQKQYFSEFLPDTSKTSSFNEKFDLGDYHNEFNSLVKDGSLLFMHNTKNANVLSLSFDSSPYKQLLLDTATESAFKVMDEAIDSGQIVLDEVLDSSSLRGLVQSIKEVVDINSEDLREGKKSLFDVLSNLPEQEKNKVIDILLDDKDVNDNTNQASFIDFVLYTALTSNGANGSKNPDAVHPISRDVPLGKRLSFHANTLRNMVKYIVSVKIKTLPFFNNIDSFNRPCFLFGLPNYVVGSTLRDAKAPAFYTNNYTIIGYKHVIDATNAYSEFSLIGDANPFGSMNTKGGMAGLFGLDLDKVREQGEEEEKQRRIEEARRNRRAGGGA
jgi:hypothetical protein